MSVLSTVCFPNASILLTVIKMWSCLVIRPWLCCAIALIPFANAPIAQAQIIPDTTLGSEASQLTPNVIVGGDIGDRIDGGAARNTFLFHSFDQFNINDGQRVYFGSPDGIATILSRVTGNDISDILGTLGVDGTADLFFLNPNGIVFGANAALDVSGSFLATTSDGFTLGDNVEFSATNPQTLPLLTVTAPIGLQFGATPGTIRNEGFLLTIGQPVTFAGGGIEIDGGTLATFLGQTELAAIDGPGTVQVSDGLDGKGDRLSIPDTVERGDITLSNGAAVQAMGGPNVIVTAENLRILDSSRLRTGILGGFEDISNEGGDVIVDLTGSLDIQNNSGINTVLADGTIGDNGDIFIDAQDILLTNGSEINARAEGGGTITINTGTLTAQNDSVIRTGTVVGLGDMATHGGNIIINATGAVALQGNESGLSNALLAGSRGINGNITINADSLTLEDAFINTGLNDFAQGQIGDVVINVAGAVSIQNDSFIRANNFLGSGNAGRISITSDALILEELSGIFADIILDPDVNIGEGQAGTVQINANALRIAGNSVIAAEVFNQGEAELTDSRDAGQVIIQSDMVQVVDGGEVLARSPRGNGGTIDVRANTLILEDASIFSRSSGAGVSGDIDLTVAESIMASNGQIDTGANNDADGGTITINGDRLFFDNLSTITSGGFGSGNAGNIGIVANQVTLQNGSKILGSTAESGRGSDIYIQARDFVEIIGFGRDVNPDGIPFPALSNISAQTFGDGDAGQIQIDTGRLLLQNGGVIGTGNIRSNSRSGDIIINALESVEITGTTGLLTNFEEFSENGNFGFNEGLSFPSVLSSDSALGDGRAGDIAITTSRLLLQGGGQINANTNGRGTGGQISIDATESVTIVGTTEAVSFMGSSGLTQVGLPSTIQLDTGSSGNAGELVINTGRLQLQDGGAIRANTRGSGSGGAVTINASELVSITGFREFPSGARALSQIISGTTSDGNARTLSINTKDLTVQELGRILANTSGSGNAGQLDINASGAVRVLGQRQNQEGVITHRSQIAVNVNPGASGNGGSLRLNANSIEISDGAFLNASTSGMGNAGDVLITANDDIRLLEGSRIQTAVRSDAVGNAGRLTIEGRSLTVNNSNVRADTSGMGDGGTLNIQMNEDITLSNNSLLQTLVGLNGVGHAGTITIGGRSLTLNNGSAILADTLGNGNGGTLDIRVMEAIDLSGDSFIEAVVGPEAVGSAGNIGLAGGSLTLSDSQILASTFGDGSAGTITLQIQDAINLFRDSRIVTAINPGGMGTAGDITLDGRSLTLRDGSTILASVNAANEGVPGGRGQGGTITLFVSDRIEIDGIAAGGFSSGIISNTEQGASGRGGNIVVDTGELRLTNGGVLAARTANESRSGDIAVEVDGNLSIRGGAQILTTTFDQGNAGNITLTVGDRILLSGTDPTYDERLAEFGLPTVDPSSPESGIFANAEADSSGDAGRIQLNSQRLTLQDQASVASSSSGIGNADNISITADRVVLGDRATITAQTQRGTGGNIDITTGPLQLSDNSTITAETVDGVGGNIGVEAQDIRLDQSSTITAETDSGTGGNIKLTGQTITLGDRATITTAATSGSSGDISITAADLQLSERSRILAKTDSGDGGDINIDARGSLTVTNSDISASTATGVAGDMLITADESVLLRGNGGLSVQATGTDTIDSNPENRQGVRRTAEQLAQGDATRSRLRTTPLLPEAGSLTVTTSTLQVVDGAIITVSSPGGLAGELAIEAGQIQLENGILEAIAGVSNTQDNATIQLNVNDLLRLQNGSLLSAEALNDANGGNITISNAAGFIVGDRFSDSDIVADASLGNGGNINITTQGIYGLEVREARSPFSDITASSEAGIDGIIEIETPGIEPERSVLEPLPLVDGAQLVSQVCPNGLARTNADDELGEFIVTGRGGLPSNPGELMESRTILTEWATLPKPEDPGATAFVNTELLDTEEQTTMPVEAQRLWVMEDGAIALIADSNSNVSMVLRPCSRN
ncbi:MAG: filamentous hemagglutinin N-terminal domain-containing protein [Cyanobacteria bacterium P01_F01_bin.150]